MELTNRRMRSVGSFRVLDYRASVGQCPYWVRRCSKCVWARYPLSMSLFIVRTRCSNPIWVALSLKDVNPRPSSCKVVFALLRWGNCVEGL
jgi:hypothetical protein